MDNAQLSEVSQGWYQLLKQLASLFFFQPIFRSDETKKFAITAVFHDQEKAIGRLNGFIKLDYVRMADHFEYMNLSTDSLHIVDVRNFAFV